MTRMYGFCCVVLRNGQRIPIAVKSRGPAAGNINVCKNGGMSEYFVHNFCI